jgi:hypothetical protein
MLQGAVPPGTRAPACGSPMRLTAKNDQHPQQHPTRKPTPRSPSKITQMHSLCSHQITQYYLQELKTNTYGSFYFRSGFQERRRRE